MKAFVLFNFDRASAMVNIQFGEGQFWSIKKSSTLVM